MNNFNELFKSLKLYCIGNAYVVKSSLLDPALADCKNAYTVNDTESAIIRSAYTDNLRRTEFNARIKSAFTSLDKPDIPVVIDPELDTEIADLMY